MQIMHADGIWTELIVIIFLEKGIIVDHKGDINETN